MASFFEGLPEREASTLNGFAGNVIDRQSEHRNAESVTAALADETARLLSVRRREGLVPAGTAAGSAVHRA